AQLVERVRPFLVIASIAALIVAGVIVAIYSERQHNAQVAEAANVQAHILADPVTAALSFDDRAALREYVGALKADAEVDAVGVYDQRGRLVAGYTRSRLADRLSNVLTPD